MKDGLYIENQKIEVNDNQLFLFNYANGDVTDPQAIKNSYSKTIKIPGTPNNNRVFNNIWRMDYFNFHENWDIYGSNTFISTRTFKPWKKNTFELYNNGDLIERGYVQIISIGHSRTNPIYEVTLYGMLGDFYDKLAYYYGNDKTREGSELTIADLFGDKHYFSKSLRALNDDVYLGEHSGTIPTQNVYDLSQKSPKFTWDKRFIWNSWLMQFTDLYPVNDLFWETLVTAAPTYSGYADDFASDKMLVDMNYPQKYDNILPKSLLNDGKTYIPRQNYSLVTMQREFDEWEARNFNSSCQTPAISLGKLFQAITDYSNSQDYNIVWDKDIDITGNTPMYEHSLNNYFWRSYILLNPLEFEDSLEVFSGAQDANIEYTSTDNIQTIDLYNLTGTTEFNTIGASSPSLQLTFNEEFYPINNRSASDKVNSNGMFATTAMLANNDQTFREAYTSMKGAFVYKIDLYSGDTFLSDKSELLFIEVVKDSISFTDNQQETFNQLVSDWCNNTFGTTDYKWQTVNGKNVTSPSIDYNYIIFEEPIIFTLQDLPKDIDLKIKISKTFVSFCYQHANRLGPYNTHWEVYENKQCIWNFHGTGMNDYSSHNGWKKSLANFDSITKITDITIYDGTETAVTNRKVTPEILFNGCGSPFQYLVDWCKLFNLRFRPDKLTKTIYIEQRKNYYIDEVIDLGQQIDYSQSITIDPLYLKYKSYIFSLQHDDDTYPNMLYKRKFNDENYSQLTFNTPYEFSNETLDIFENNQYKCVIDYTLKTPYLNTGFMKDNIQYPTMLLTPKYEYKLWRSNTSELEDFEKTYYGLQSYFTLPQITDSTPKPALFDKENKPVEPLNTLVLFDGWEKMPISAGDYRPFLLSDNLEIMDTLNDGPCYLNAWYDDSKEPYNIDNFWYKRTHEGIYNKNGQRKTTGLWSFGYPRLTTSCHNKNESLYAHSYYMFTPQRWQRDVMYGNSKLGSKATIYDRYWGTFISDLYDVSNKTAELFIFINEPPQTAMRKFYKFNNCLWVIDSITDYDYKGTKPTKVKFLRVYDKNNYLQ